MESPEESLKKEGVAPFTEDEAQEFKKPASEKPHQIPVELADTDKSLRAEFGDASEGLAGKPVPVEMARPDELRPNPKLKPLEGGRLRADKIWDKPKDIDKRN